MAGLLLRATAYCLRGLRPSHFTSTRPGGWLNHSGTRHRAAIGLSEETDAISLAVSEENGMISHAYKGQLVRGVIAKRACAFLSSVLLQREKPHSAIGMGFAADLVNDPTPVAVIITQTIYELACDQTMSWRLTGFL